MIARLHDELRHFKRNAAGGVAVVFSVSLIALVMASGLALDYARSVNTLSSLQQDIDATMLFVGRKKLDAGDGAEFNAQAVADAHMKKLRRQKFESGDITVLVTEVSPGNYKAVARSSVPTTFAKMFGVTDFPVDVGSEVELGDAPVEVALVLDNTASMAGTKLDDLKSAAGTLIDTAFSALRADRNVAVGIVPFAQYVNVGQANRNVPWMSVPLDSTTTEPEVCYDQPTVTGQSNCRTETGTAANDGVPYTYTYEVCDYQYGPPVQQCYTPTTVNAWYGCAGSRDYPLETLDQDYDVKIPGVMNAACPSEIVPLTNDVNALSSHIDAMVATGETYLPSGLIWGWRLLSKNAPFAQAKGYDERVFGQKVRKILVLMSDGKNTLSPVYPAHTGNDPALADSLTLEICTNIKAKGIEIYTVAFQVPDEGAKDVLEACASGASKFFDAEDGEALEQSFQKIANDFNPLRLTR